MAAAKRRKCGDELVVAAALGSGNAVSSVLESFNNNKQLERSVRSGRRDASNLLYELPKTTTPFGPVCLDTAVQGTKGSVVVNHVNPAAMLYHAMMVSTGLRNFLSCCKSTCQDGILTVVIYLDEATPGNDKRPDRGRASQCLYWTILQFPPWFISRACGWLPFAYVHMCDLNAAGITDSVLVKFMVNACFNQVHGEGCDFIVVEGGEKFKFNVQLQVADWPQHKKSFSLKGHNGTVCCYWCANCIGHCPYFEDPLLVHFTSTEYNRFARHDLHSIEKLLVGLEHTAKHKPQDLKSQEQATGFKYEPEGLIWDPALRSKLRLPEAGYVDWMHTLVASGGFAQYELNQLLLVLEDTNIPRTAVDEWCTSVVKPAGFTKLKKTFFQDRVVTKRSAHIRAFASEMLSAITLMDMFLEFVVAPLQIPALETHIACFTLLVCIIAILQKADINDIGDLRTAIHSHHVLFMELYPACAKTKLHAGQHVADSWEFWGVLLNCFAPERYHRLMKRVMKFVYRRAPRTTLAYAVKGWFDHLAGEHAFEPIHFVGSVYVVSGSPTISFGSHVAALITHWCLKLRMPIGLISKGDLLRYVGNDGGAGLGIVVGFARLQSPASNFFLAAIRMCKPILQPVNGLRHWQHTSTHGLITVDQVRGSVPYADFGASFVPSSHA